MDATWADDVPMQTAISAALMPAPEASATVRIKPAGGGSVSASTADQRVSCRVAAATRSLLLASRPYWSDIFVYLSFLAAGAGPSSG